MKTPPNVLAVAAGMILVLSCTSELKAQGFTVLHQGYYTQNLSKRQTKVITSQQEYAATLAAYTDEQPQEVDFNAGRVLLVDMGPRPSGGFSIEVTSVKARKGSAVVADVVLTRPGASCFVTTSITNPFQFVYIPTRKEILVSESLINFECGPAPAGEKVDGDGGRR